MFELNMDRDLACRTGGRDLRAFVFLGNTILMLNYFRALQVHT